MTSKRVDVWLTGGVGGIRQDATREDLLAEIEWQKAWRKEVKAIDGNNYRGMHATDNILKLRHRLRQIEKIRKASASAPDPLAADGEDG